MRSLSRGGSGRLVLGGVDGLNDGLSEDGTLLAHGSLLSGLQNEVSQRLLRGDLQSSRLTETP